MMNSRILFFFVRSLVLLTSFFLGSCTAITEKNLLKFPVKALQEEPKTEKIPAEKVTADIRDLTGFAVDEDVLITTSMFGSDYGLDVFDRTSALSDWKRTGGVFEYFSSVFHNGQCSSRL